MLLGTTPLGAWFFVARHHRIPLLESNPSSPGNDPCYSCNKSFIEGLQESVRPRGGMDASQYKDYVLVLLFVKYVSDKCAGQRDPLLEIPRGGGFAEMIAIKGDKEILPALARHQSRSYEGRKIQRGHRPCLPRSPRRTSSPTATRVLDSAGQVPRADACETLP